LTTTSYKCLDIGINVAPVFSVEIVIGDKRGNQILLHATWEMFIERRANIEQLLQSPAPSSLAIQDLIVELVKIHDVNMVKLKLHDACLYIKSSIVLFMFELEHCINHAYFELCKILTSMKNFTMCNLYQNCITNKFDAANILRKIYDKNSNVECKLIAYALNNIVHNALKNVLFTLQNYFFRFFQLKIIFSLHTRLLYLCKSVDYTAHAVARLRLIFRFMSPISYSINSII